MQIHGSRDRSRTRCIRSIAARVLRSGAANGSAAEVSARMRRISCFGPRIFVVFCRTTLSAMVREAV
ncbi:hypothetical protein [Burkholderia sp. AU16741]|uniref:hypothetical protein n=1 Tax=Burkholderia sp. AU16741 TaxID=2015347 RepID=UPI00117F7054|nr:hypothetical protein [Burkholderia sp. AU16741]